MAKGFFSAHILLYIIILLLLSTQAKAARPFVTDDARLTSSGSCQLESWTRLYENSSEIWALPACNPFGNLEVTLGAGVSRDDNAATTQDYIAQIKTLFKPLETNGWGIGFAAGRVFHPEINAGPNLFGNTYLYVPASFSFNDDQLVIHTNIGLLKEDKTNAIKTTFGIGSEYRLTNNVLGIAELFGDDKQKPFMQIGFRYSLMPNLFQLDATLGQPVAGKSEDSWLSFGARFTPEKLF
jgi:hypothetical protein